MLVDSNCEYEFHPEIYSALRRIDKSIFNSLFFTFFLNIGYTLKRIFLEILKNIDTRH